MTNKYLEKIAGMASYLINGSKKLNQVSQRVSHIRARNAQAATDKLSKAGPFSMKSADKSMQHHAARDSKLNYIGAKASQDAQRAGRVVQGAKATSAVLASLGAAGAAALAAKKSQNG